MASDKQTPEIRFLDFSDNWKERKLGEYVQIISGNAPSEFSEGNVNYVKVDDLNNAYKTIFETKSKVDKHSTVEKVKKGSIIFPKRGAAILTNKVRILGVDSYMDTNMMALTTERLHSEFLYVLISKEGLYKIADTSTIPQINNKHIEPYKIMIPGLSEQDKIGKLFDHLDNLISLHQKKHTQLITIKKAMLEKMFPKEGETVPEIRFAGFTKPWEHVELNTIALFNPKDDLPEKFEYVDLESVSGTEMISHRTEYKTSAPSRAQRLAKPGDIFYQTVRPYQKNNYLFEKAEDNYVFSTGYAQMRPYIDGQYLFTLIQLEQFVQVVLNNCTGTSYPAINANDLAKIEVFISKNKIEQQKIGAYFHNLDKLITLQQKKIDQLQHVKKAFLDKMFV